MGVCEDALNAVRMIVKEGLGEGESAASAKGLMVVVGNAKEIFADEERQKRQIKTKWGTFRKQLDVREDEIRLQDCLAQGEDKTEFLTLAKEDGAVVVDSETGTVCCGGFFVTDLKPGKEDGGGGTRYRAASAMAVQAGKCYVVLASQTICGSVNKPPPDYAELQVFKHTNEPEQEPVWESKDSGGRTRFGGGGNVHFQFNGPVSKNQFNENVYGDAVFNAN